jgi:hypothetical protein
MTARPPVSELTPVGSGRRSSAAKSASTQSTGRRPKCGLHQYGRMRIGEIDLDRPIVEYQEPAAACVEWLLLIESTDASGLLAVRTG